MNTTTTGESKNVSIYKCYGDLGAFYGVEFRYNGKEYKIRAKDGKMTNNAFTPDVGEILNYQHVITITVEE
jgi:hypothetical protein